MLLGVNGIRLLGNRSGVGRVIEAVLASLEAVDHPFSEVRVYTPASLRDEVRLPPTARSVVVPSSLPPGLWEQVVLPRTHGHTGVLLCPSYVVPLLARCPTMLIHHGSYEAHPEAFGRYRTARAAVMYALSAHRATVMSTVSRSSMADIVRYYRVRPEKVHVVPDGVDTRLFKPLGDDDALRAWRERTLGVDVPFLLYVGKPTKRRNLGSLLRALRLLRAHDGLPHHLLLVGTGLAGSPVQPLVDELCLSDAVHTVGHASHDELVFAYNAADLLVYPSSYEGFGMPVLEAMACGTPALALDNTAFPEFAGGVAELVADADPETLADGIRRVVNDPERRRWMSREGRRRALDYDWEIVTRAYVNLLTSVAP